MFAVYNHAVSHSSLHTVTSAKEVFDTIDKAVDNITAIFNGDDVFAHAALEREVPPLGNTTARTVKGGNVAFYDVPAFDPSKTGFNYEVFRKLSGGVERSAFPQPKVVAGFSTEDVSTTKVSSLSHDDISSSGGFPHLVLISDPLFYSDMILFRACTVIRLLEKTPICYWTFR